MSARSRWPRLLWSRKYCRSWASAGWRAGRITVSASTIASSWARESMARLSLRDRRCHLLDHEAVARDGEAQFQGQVMVVQAEPHVDDLALVLGVDVAHVKRTHVADRHLDRLDA